MSNRLTEEQKLAEDRKYWVEMKESLERLEQNEDFKKVILEGYLKDKALNGVAILADPGIKQRGERSDVMEELVAIANLRYYLGMIYNLGDAAKQDLEEIEANKE